MNLAEQTIRQYYEGFRSFPQDSIYRMWIAEGRSPLQLPLDASERAAWQRLRGRIRKIESQQCFANSQQLIERDTENLFEYWEGYMTSPSLIIPIHHAWITINNKVIDATHEANIRRRIHQKLDPLLQTARKRQRQDKDQSYFGFPIKREDVIQHLLETHLHSPVTEMSSWVVRWFEQHPKEGTDVTS